VLYLSCDASIPKSISSAICSAPDDSKLLGRDLPALTIAWLRKKDAAAPAAPNNP